MKKIIALLILVALTPACQSSYLTPEGGRLLQNSALGCFVGDIFFDNCKAGVAVGAGATIIDDQTN